MCADEILLHRLALAGLSDQLRRTLQEVGLNVDGAQWEQNPLMLRSCLTAGLLPNVAETEFLQECVDRK